jgi:hypothetical protein
MSEEDREQVAKLIAQLDAQQAAIQELLRHVKKAAAPKSPDPDAHTPERRKSPRPKKTPR